MWKVANEFSVKLGGNYYINTPNLVVYKGQSLFKIYRSENDGMLGIDFDVLNSEGKRVATFRKGIVVQGDSDKYLIESGHDEYKVTEKATGKIIANVKRRNVPDAEIEVSVSLYMPDGFLFNATPTQTNIGGSVIAGCTIKNCGAGIVIA